MGSLENKKIMEFVTRCAGHYYRELKRSGFNIEYDDLKGDIGLLYSKALTKYDPTRETATFETYVTRIVINYIKKLKDTIVKNGWLCSRVPVTALVFYERQEENQTTPEEDYIKAETLTQMSADPRFDMLIIEEVTNPSPKIHKWMENCKKTRASENANYRRSVHRAIEGVYGLSRGQISRQVASAKASNYFQIY